MIWIFRSFIFVSFFFSRWMEGNMCWNPYDDLTLTKKSWNNSKSDCYFNLKHFFDPAFCNVKFIQLLEGFYLFVNALWIPLRNCVQKRHSRITKANTFHQLFSSCANADSPFVCTLLHLIPDIFSGLRFLTFAAAKCVFSLYV